MSNPNTEDLVTIGQPVAIQKLLDELPAMVGGIDHAIRDVSGKHMPFVLLVFGENGVLHATNMTPAAQAVVAIKELAAKWETDAPRTHV